MIRKKERNQRKREQKNNKLKIKINNIIINNHTLSLLFLTHNKKVYFLLYMQIVFH